MRIVVVGAGGGTGRLIVDEGLRRGHELVAVSRRGTGRPEVTDVQADATDPAALAEAFRVPPDAVVVAIGGAPGNPRNRTDVTRAVLTALPDGSRPRVVVQSSIGAGDSMRFLPPLMRPVVSLTLGKALADHTEQEALVTGSGLPWTVVRPGQLTDKPASDKAVALTQPGTFVPVLSRADVARLILDLLADPASEGGYYALGTAG